MAKKRKKKPAHLVFALLDASSDAVECRAASLLVIQDRSGCKHDALPDPAVSPTPAAGEASDTRYSKLLRTDLHMSPIVIKALAPQFSKIARRYKASASISQAKCSALVTVADAVVLVTTAAGL